MTTRAGALLRFAEYRKWTGSVEDRQATAEEVLKGMPAPVEARA